MLCKRGIEPRAGYWTITAGFMENDESIEQGALREAFEEAGIQPKLGRLLTAYSVPMANQVHVYFEGVLDSDQFTLTPESTDIRFFAEQDIPWEEIAFPSVVYALKRFFEDRKSGNTINTHIGMSPVMQ
jgi:ADP-ribose pyrophosphatase YjhB (NUDIX family)